MVNIYLSLALGGALGTCSRYAFGQWMAKTFPAELSWGTLSINVIGSFLIGVFFVLIQEKMQLPPSIKPLVMTGFLGGFTTFSTFSLETVNHLLQGQYVSAITYVLLSVLLCVLFCFVGIFITRLL